MNAYSDTYLEDVMDNLGSMLDGAVRLGIPAGKFTEMFLRSEVCAGIEVGHPRYLAGLSGPEMLYLILSKEMMDVPETSNIPQSVSSPEYWAFWALAYLQWETGEPFRFLLRNGLDIDTILSLYPTMHEADLSAWEEVALHRIEAFQRENAPALKRLRRSAGLTQETLARQSGVSLRMIRAYEQRTQDLSKAEYRTILRIAHALHCTPADLLAA